VNCCDVVGLLSAELDGELSASESMAVRAHLPSCRDCERRYELLIGTRAAFRSVAAAPSATPRSVIAAALAVATVAAVVVGLSVLKPPARPPEPHRNANAAIECGVTGSPGCIVELPPCSGEDCALLTP
jgi:hypothetical protein